MVVAAHDVGDAHVVIVDDDGEHVGRRAVGAQKHHVVELRVLEMDIALHDVAHDRLAFARRLEAHHGLDARRRFLRIAVAPAPVIADGPPLGARLGPHLLELGRRGIAMVGAP